MAIDPSELEQYGQSIDEHVHDEFVKRFGAEVAKLFFNQLPEEPAVRSDVLTNQAKVLSLLRPIDDVPIVSIDSDEADSLADVVDIAEYVHDQTAAVELVGGRFENEQKEHREWVPSSRFTVFTNGIVRRHDGMELLNLQESDKEAFILALLDLRGNVTRKSRPPYAEELLSAMYDGDSRAQSAQRFGVDPVTISNRQAFLDARIAKQVKQSGIDPLSFILARLQEARGEAQVGLVDKEPEQQIEAIDDPAETVEVVASIEETSSDTQGYLDITAYHSVAPQRAFTVNVGRLYELKRTDSDTLRQNFIEYVESCGDASVTRSIKRIIDMNETPGLDVDYAFGRAYIRSLIDTEQGQAIYATLHPFDRDKLQHLADYELEKGEKPKILKQIIAVTNYRFKDKTEKTLLAALNAMTPR